MVLLALAPGPESAQRRCLVASASVKLTDDLAHVFFLNSLKIDSLTALIKQVPCSTTTSPGCLRPHVVQQGMYNPRTRALFAGKPDSLIGLSINHPVSLDLKVRDGHLQLRGQNIRYDSDWWRFSPEPLHQLRLAVKYGQKYLNEGTSILKEPNIYPILTGQVLEPTGRKPGL
ncbi:hypothetical protein Tco_1153867 [Tanacetum coccineum]